MAIGIAAALLFLQPDNLQDMVLGSGIAAVGSVISDIDIGTSESHKDANKISALSAAAAAAVVVLDRLWNLGLAQKILQDSSGGRIAFSAALFLLVCILGKETRHRSFMHSFAALLILSGCVSVFMPQMTIYFTVAFLSHLFIDLLNRKGEQLFYPFKKRFCFGWCSAKGIVNNTLYTVGSLTCLGAAIALCARICLF